MAHLKTKLKNQKDVFNFVLIKMITWLNKTTMKKKKPQKKAKITETNLMLTS